jgi:hypothetical protein
MKSVRVWNLPPGTKCMAFSRVLTPKATSGAQERGNTRGLCNFCPRAKPCYIETSLSHRPVTCNIPNNYEECDATHGD